MITKLYPFLFMLLLVVAGCGSDDKDPEQEEPEMSDCGGDISIFVDGVSEEFGEPLSATLVNLNFESGSELLVVWAKNGYVLDFQIVITESDLACFPTGRISLSDLPSNITLLSFQYSQFGGNTGSVSNIFSEDGGNGWVDIKTCDGESDILSVAFEFDAVTANGELFEVRGGSAADICFDRSK